MAQTTISDLWTPDIWIQGATEKAKAFPSLLNSGVVVQTPLFDTIASGAGVSANIPFYKDISDDTDTIQIEDTGPTLKEITAGRQVCPILNRVVGYDVTALSAQVSGASPDPVGEILNQVGAGRVKRRQRTMVSILRGAFGGGDSAKDAAAELSSLRLEYFAEDAGGSPTDSQKMSADLFIAGKYRLGELADGLGSGAILTHPNIVAQLEILDKESFKDGVASGLSFAVRTYRGVPIFSSELLVRAGSGGGGTYVYETYILGRSTVGFGAKAQSSTVGDVAHMVLDETQIAKNNVSLYDRNRYLLHLNGMKWVGTPAGQSATDAELADPANWDLAYSSAARVGGVLIRTNG
jgi:hypothetical protein